MTYRSLVIEPLVMTIALQCHCAGRAQVARCRSKGFRLMVLSFCLRAFSRRTREFRAARLA